MEKSHQATKLLMILGVVFGCLAQTTPSGANQEGNKKDPTAPDVQPESDEHAYARKQYAAALQWQLNDMQMPSHWTDQAAYRAFPFEKLSKDINALKDGPWNPAVEVMAKEAFSSLGFTERVQLAKVRMDRADECARVYRETIDKKTSDLTTRDNDSIKTCKILASYPPPKEQKEAH